MADGTPEFFDPTEDCEEHTPREIFARYGYAPISPGELNDRQSPGRLWELLYATAARRFFFCFTDHLNDGDNHYVGCFGSLAEFAGRRNAPA